MASFSDMTNVGDKVVAINRAKGIKLFSSYTIESKPYDGNSIPHVDIQKGLYFCYYIGSEKYHYQGIVCEHDAADVREEEETRRVLRFDFVRVDDSTNIPRFVSINEQHINKYDIKEQSLDDTLADSCNIMGGKKKSKKSKKSRRSNKSRKTRRT